MVAIAFAAVRLMIGAGWPVIARWVGEMIGGLGMARHDEPGLARPIEAVAAPAEEDRPGRGWKTRSTGMTARAWIASVGTSGSSCWK